MLKRKWTVEAQTICLDLKQRATTAYTNRKQQGKTKSSKIEGLFKQVHKTLELLSQDPQHPGLKTQVYSNLTNPYDKTAKVFEAYVQNNMASAYRIFWCYGPDKGEITILAITPHP
jgi:hypothetical protein